MDFEEGEDAVRGTGGEETAGVGEGVVNLLRFTSHSDGSDAQWGCRDHISGGA